jgi:hypothetical protein
VECHHQQQQRVHKQEEHLEEALQEYISPASKEQHNDDEDTRADMEIKALIMTPSEPSITCCIDAILMLLFISRPIKSCKRNLQSSTQMFMHRSISNKKQMVEDIIFLLPMKLL